MTPKLGAFEAMKLRGPASALSGEILIDHLRKNDAAEARFRHEPEQDLARVRECHRYPPLPEAIFRQGNHCPAPERLYIARA